MTSTRRTAGSALWVVSVLGLVAIVANLVASVFDVTWLDLPGPGIVYVALTIAASSASAALLKQERS